MYYTNIYIQIYTNYSNYFFNIYRYLICKINSSKLLVIKYLIYFENIYPKTTCTEAFTAMFKVFEHIANEKKRKKESFSKICILCSLSKKKSKLFALNAP